MKSDKLTRRQYFALSSMAVLSPALRLLPREDTAIAGSASWLCGVAAYVPLLLFALLVNAMLNCRREGEGMGDLILRALGSVVGKSCWPFTRSGFCCMQRSCCAAARSAL